MHRHPSKRSLFDHAEALATPGKPISAALARHIASCARCAAAMESIRRNLSLLEQAGELQPNERLTAQILSAGWREMQARHAGQAVWRRRWRMAQGLTYAAGVVVVATFWFQATFSTASSETVPVASVQMANTTDEAAEPAQDAENARYVRRIDTLAAAVAARSGTPRSVEEYIQERRLRTFERERQEAMAALERNPGNRRAAQVMDASLQGAALTSTALYVQRDQR